MAGLNRCTFIGNLGKDPVMRFTGEGKAVASFSLGVNSSWKDKNGVQQKHTEWINCTAFDKLAEIIGKYLKSGSKIYAEGRHKTEKYQDRNGEDRYATKIIVTEMQMLDSKPKDEQQAAPRHAAVAQEMAGESFFNDEMPGFDDDLQF